MNNKILQEQLLLSDFVFGFELEGLMNVRNAYQYLVVNEDDDDFDPDEIQSIGLDEIEVILDKLFEDEADPSSYIGYGTTVGDTSIQGGDYENIPFEWNSPKIKYSPKVLSATIKFLSELIETQLIKTNSSCGFHVHLSYKDMDIDSMVWIYLNLCYALADSNQDILDIIMMKDSQGNTIKLFTDPSSHNSSYANANKMLQLGELLKRNKLNDDNLLNFLSTEKYRMLRLHPQGTLEWRGPRDFLNTGSVDDIKIFFLNLIKFIKKLIEYQDKKELPNGVKKQEILNFIMDKRQNSSNDENDEDKKELPKGKYLDEPLNVKGDIININKRFTMLHDLEKMRKILTNNSDEYKRDLLTTLITNQTDSEIINNIIICMKEIKDINKIVYEIINKKLSKTNEKIIVNCLLLTYQPLNFNNMTKISKIINANCHDLVELYKIIFTYNIKMSFTDTTKWVKENLILLYTNGIDVIKILDLILAFIINNKKANPSQILELIAYCIAVDIKYMVKDSYKNPVPPQIQKAIGNILSSAPENYNDFINFIVLAVIKHKRFDLLALIPKFNKNIVMRLYQMFDTELLSVVDTVTYNKIKPFIIKINQEYPEMGQEETE